MPGVAALDVFWSRVLPAPAPWLAGLGLALFASGWALKGLALRANAFAVPAVRLQRERAHAVVDSGVHGVVRHPFYATGEFIQDRGSTPDRCRPDLRRA